MELVFFSIVAVGYGVTNILGILYHQYSIKYNLSQINSNSQVESTFLECMNYLKLGILDETYMVYERKNGLSMLNDCLENFYKMDTVLFDFQDHIASRNSAFSNLFEQIYFSNLCDVVVDSKDGCHYLIAGNLKNVWSAHTGVYLLATAHLQLDGLVQE